MESVYTYQETGGVYKLWMACSVIISIVLSGYEQVLMLWRDPFTLLHPPFRRLQAFNTTPSIVQDKAGNTQLLVTQLIS